MAIVTLSKVKTFLQITGTDKDDLISALIPEVEADYLRIRNRDFDEDSNEDIEYPDGSELTAAQMIGFHLTDLMRAGGGFSSESVGKYSYSAAELQDGYPKAIVRRIDRYVGSK